MRVTANHVSPFTAPKNSSLSCRTVSASGRIMTTAMSTAAVMALPVNRISPYLTARPAASKFQCFRRFSSPLHRPICTEESPKLSLLVGRRKSITTVSAKGGDGGGNENENVRRVLQTLLWLAEGIYILWLFLLPYAPGDPVWAISSETVNSLVGLSLNFFFVLPLLNSVGIHFIDAPVLHPMDEGLFNFVIGWTFMFAPLLFTDRKRDRFKGSLDILWGFQMFLTNTFLIPYMAIRLNEADEEGSQRETTQLASVMTKGAPYVALIGGGICSISALWAFFGRADGNFGDTMQRLEYLVSYLGSERLAYAFIWDICLYVVFQPWLIGDNIQNVKKSKVALVNYPKFVPVVGIVAYLLSLNLDDDYS